MGKKVIITILQQIRGLLRYKFVKCIHKEKLYWMEVIGRTEHAECDTCFNTPGFMDLISFSSYIPLKTFY